MKEVQLDDQAIGAIMMALQKSLLEQSDIVPTLKGFKFALAEGGLVVMNPPLVKFTDEVDGEVDDSQQDEDVSAETA